MWCTSFDVARLMCGSLMWIISVHVTNLFMMFFAEGAFMRLLIPVFCRFWSSLATWFLAKLVHGVNNTVVNQDLFWSSNNTWLLSGHWFPGTVQRTSIVDSIVSCGPEFQCDASIMYCKWYHHAAFVVQIVSDTINIEVIMDTLASGTTSMAVTPTISLRSVDS